MNDSFYITLPSNASMYIFPNNKQSNFTTVLARPIELNGRYEVALTEVSYSPRFESNLGYIYISNPFVTDKKRPLIRSPEIFLRLQLEDSLKTSLLFEILKIQLEELVLATELELRRTINIISDEKVRKILLADNVSQYEVAKPSITIFRKPITAKNFVYEIVDFKSSSLSQKYQAAGFNYNEKKGVWDCFNIVLSSKDDSDEFSLWEKQFSYNVIEIPFEPSNEWNPFAGYGTKALVKISKFTYSESTGISISVIGEEYCRIEGPLALMWSNHPIFTIESVHEWHNTVNRGMVDTIRVLHRGIIYSDIVDDQFFGDALAPVIHTFDIRRSNDPITVHSLETLHYLPVNKSILSSINIRILDLSGEPLKFSNIFSIVIVKLHFRKI